MRAEAGWEGREDWAIRLLFDGACPICSRKKAALERRDRGRGRLQFEDISAPGFDPSVYGLDEHSVMDRMHGVLPDGRVVEGLEAFRHAYSAIGLGWLLAPTGWPGLRRLADAAYRVFARNRMRLSGRPHACEDGRCAIEPGGRRPVR